MQTLMRPQKKGREIVVRLTRKKNLVIVLLGAKEKVHDKSIGEENVSPILLVLVALVQGIMVQGMPMEKCTIRALGRKMCPQF